MAEDSGRDRRRHTRYGFRTDTLMMVAYKGEGPLSYGDCIKVSGDTIALKVPDPIPPGKKLELKLGEPGSHEHHIVAGVVEDVIPAAHHAGDRPTLLVRLHGIEPAAARVLAAMEKGRPVGTARRSQAAGSVARGESPPASLPSRRASVRPEPPEEREAARFEWRKMATETELPAIGAVTEPGEMEELRRMLGYVDGPVPTASSAEGEPDRRGSVDPGFRGASPAPTVAPTPAPRRGTTSDQQAPQIRREVASQAAQLSNQDSTEIDLVPSGDGVRATLRYQSARGMRRAVTQNISKGGLMIRSDRPLDIGSELHVTLVPPGRKDGIWFSASVVWADGSGGYGLELADLTEGRMAVLRAILDQLEGAGG